MGHRRREAVVRTVGDLTYSCENTGVDASLVQFAGDLIDSGLTFHNSLVLVTLSDGRLLLIELLKYNTSTFDDDLVLDLLLA